MTSVAIAMQRAPQRTPGWVKTSTTKFVNIVGSGVYGETRLPSDALGNTTVTFDGVVAGSEIRVYLPDGVGGSAGTEVAGLDSCVAQQQLTWPVYAGGSPNNTVWIHIIKRGLRWMKFPYASKSGAQSIPIFQNTDLGYNNPA